MQSTFFYLSIGVLSSFLHSYWGINSEFIDLETSHAKENKSPSQHDVAFNRTDLDKREVLQRHKRRIRYDSNFLYDISEVVKSIALRKDFIYIDLCSTTFDSEMVGLVYLTKRLSNQFLLKMCDRVSRMDNEDCGNISLKRKNKCFTSPEFEIKNCEEKRMKIWISVTSNGEAVIHRLKQEIVALRDGVLNVVIINGEMNSTWGSELFSTTHWVYCLYNENKRSFRLLDVYTFQTDSRALLENSGSWNISRGLTLEDSALGRGPTNFYRKTIRIACFPTPPYFVRNSDCLLEENKWDECIKSKYVVNAKMLYSGYLVDMLDTLAESLNFTYLMIEPPKDKWVFGIGERDNFSGLVGMVYKEEADIAPSSFIVTNDRSDVVDFSPSIDYYSKSLFVRSESFQEDMGWATYSRGFHWTTWICILILWIICSTTHTVFRMIKSYIYGNPEITEDSLIGLPGVSFMDSTFMYYGCIVQQGTPNTPTSYSLRFVFGYFWASCVVLYASYTAVITAFLAVNTEEPPFNSLKEAVENSDWEVGILDGTPTYEQIKNAKGDFYRKLFADLSRNSEQLLASSDEEGIKKILNSNFAYFSDTVSMRYLTKGNCSIREIRLDMFPSYGHLVYMKNLPFKSILDEKISFLSTSGVLDRFQNKYWTNIAPCRQSSPYSELGFSHTLTAFLILIIGICLAWIILFVERMRNKQQNRVRPIQNKNSSTFSNEKSPNL